MGITIHFSHKVGKSDDVRIANRKFKSKIIQSFQCDNYTEHHHPRCYEIPDILQVTGLDKVRSHELHDHEHTDQTEEEDKETQGQPAV
jgi:hypothetical protein